MTQNVTLTREQIRRAPKVVLHDHLDGGLRPATVVELAAAVGHELPTTDAAALGEWFREQADSGSLVRYLETFEHTVGVMQTADALRRVAREYVEDLVADGVVYAEVRWAPEQHLRAGLTLDETVAAVQEGLEEGMEAAEGTVLVGQLLTAMRHADRALEIAELTIAWRDRGVVGFDIAGAEDGFPPALHREAFDLLRENNVRFTIHAGEAHGLPSIAQALHTCGADRLGHGVRIVDDITVHDDGTATLGRLASYVRDKRIPLEVAPASNVQTAAAPSLAEHQIDLLTRLGFRVTLNTDNRLMSNTSMTDEMTALVETFGYDLEVLAWFTVNAMRSAFVDYDTRVELIEEVIVPGYESLDVEVDADADVDVDA
ncbi:adenosine deaminase [Nocardioides yefusunii]|uniref:Adenosine deaminase n=1 Tax=Nocardioides yefusunii TaxID=2500546 RepID=A0ABW1QZX3_9ACTN|nr:adenosine deaminase [Nocardioides yefusunii]